MEEAAKSSVHLSDESTTTRHLQSTLSETTLAQTLNQATSLSINTNITVTPSSDSTTQEIIPLFTTPSEYSPSTTILPLSHTSSVEKEQKNEPFQQPESTGNNLLTDIDTITNKIEGIASPMSSNVGNTDNAMVTQPSLYATKPMSYTPSPSLIPKLPASYNARVPSASNVSSSQIDADMMQIDSILKALNTGTFDQVDMATIDVLTQVRPQNIVSDVQIGPSAGLNLIRQLGSDEESSSSDSEGTTSDEEEDTLTKKRIEEEEGEDGDVKQTENKKYGYPMTKGEIDYRDLPLEEETAVLCPDDVELTAVGKVLHTTEKLTVIESYPKTPVIAEGTIFWSSSRLFVGKLFETFGPVKSPFYSVRVIDDSVTILMPGTEVFVVLNDPTLTQYVFMEEILKQRGSDASWLHDHEVPNEFQDYSDDEQEQQAKSHSRPQKTDSHDKKIKTQGRKKCWHMRQSTRLPTNNYIIPHNQDIVQDHSPSVYSSQGGMSSSPCYNQWSINNSPVPCHYLPQNYQYLPVFAPQPFVRVPQNSSYGGYVNPWNATYQYQPFSGQAIHGQPPYDMSESENVS